MSDLQDKTELAVFKPTTKMKEWLDTAIMLMTESPTKISEESKIARQTWYDWHRLEGFEDWFYDEYKKSRRKLLPRLDEIGMKFATKGDHNFWRDMNKKAGEDLDPRSMKATEVDTGEIRVRIIETN